MKAKLLQHRMFRVVTEADITELNLALNTLNSAAAAVLLWRCIEQTNGKVFIHDLKAQENDQADTRRNHHMHQSCTDFFGGHHFNILFFKATADFMKTFLLLFLRRKYFYRLLALDGLRHIVTDVTHIALHTAADSTESLTRVIHH